jgi:hypothetical protein
VGKEQERLKAIFLGGERRSDYLLLTAEAMTSLLPIVLGLTGNQNGTKFEKEKNLVVQSRSVIKKTVLTKYCLQRTNNVVPS